MNRPERETSPDHLLTIDEAAACLRVSRWSVYNLIRANQLRTVKIGRRRLVLRPRSPGASNCSERRRNDRGRTYTPR
jgi:excisionase family DNA binding protein